MNGPLAAVRVPVEGEDAPDVWTMPVDELDERADISALDDRERRRADALLRPRDRRAFIAAHLLLRQLLGRRLGCAPGEIAYGRQRCPVCGGPRGRPVLDPPQPALHFSLSRSGDMVLVALAAVAVGVDIQRVSDRETQKEVTPLLHPAEELEIAGAPAEEQTRTFTRIWTRKEAYLKGVGTGLAHELSREYLGNEERAGPPAGWIVCELPAHESYIAAVAWRPSGSTAAQKM